MLKSEKLRALILSLLLFGVFLAAWQIGTMPATGTQTVDDEYAKLVGAAASSGQKSAFPTPTDVGRKLVEQLSDPFYDKGPNDKGIGIQLAWSVGRVGLGFGLAALVAVPGMPSSSDVSRRMRLSATISPVTLSSALYTTPWAPPKGARGEGAQHRRVERAEVCVCVCV